MANNTPEEKRICSICDQREAVYWDIGGNEEINHCFVCDQQLTREAIDLGDSDQYDDFTEDDI